MPNYSHRDHRGYRAAYRLLGLVASGTVALVAMGLWAPWSVLGLLALLGLGVLGGAALWASGNIAEGYVDDIRRAGGPGSAPSLLRVEVDSRIGLERPVFVGARPSPHVRRPRVDPATDRGAGLPTRDRA
jgi:hypothetical protein